MLSDVNTALSGFALANNGLRFIKDRNCIIRKGNWFPKRKVKLIAGGGIGHGPAFYAYVGKGMLDGAVIGRGFGPPSVRSIVDCLRMVAKPNEAVLFIVNNYFKPRLHFGLAIERARARYGYKELKMLINEDDYDFVGTPLEKPSERRGLAGCIVLIKILGAMAEKGSSLNKMIEFGEGLLQNCRLGSFGATFDEIHHRLEQVEPGKGIHGEHSMGKAEYYGNFNSFVIYGRRTMVHKMDLDSKSKMVLLVNNNGGVSESAMSQLIDSLCKCFGMNHTVSRIYVGNFFSPVNPSGVSVTLVDGNYRPELMEYLNFEVKVASSLFDGGPLHSARASKAMKFKGKLEMQAPQLVQMSMLRFDDSTKSIFRSFLKKLVQLFKTRRAALNAAGEECRLGAVGSQMVSAARALRNLSDEELGFPYPAKISQSFSSILERKIRGHLGPIHGLFFEAAAKAFVDANKATAITAQHWLDALTRGNDAIAEYTRYKVNDRTMLCALKWAEDRLRSFIQENPNPFRFSREFANSCYSGSQRTIGMQKLEAEVHVAQAQEVRHFRYEEAGSYVVTTWAWALFTSMPEDYSD